MASHYDALEVSPRASDAVIRAAYKSLMQQHHPDKHANLSDATARATRIAQAYAVLSDPQQRLAYDQASLGQAAAAAMQPGNPAPRAHRARAAAGSPPKPLITGYAWLLIVCIVGSGWVIERLSTNRTATVAAPAGSATRAAPATPGTPDSLPGTTSANPAGSVLGAGANGAAAAVPGTAMVTDFTTDLSIALGPTGGTGSGSALRLHIPALALRLSVVDAPLWAQKIETQRPQLIGLLLNALAGADPASLNRSDGEAHLKRLIEDTLSAGIGLNPMPAAPAASDLPAPRALQALLAQSYSVR